MAMVEMKNLKLAAAFVTSLAIPLALLGCGKSHIKFSSSQSALTSVQTANGELQVVSVSRQFIGDQLSADYQVAVTLTHAGRTVSLNAYMTPQNTGFDSENFNADYYAMSTACASDSCDEFAALYTYGNFGSASTQFAVLYKVAPNGSVTKESEAQGTSFNSAEESIWTLRRMING
jgi:hypothetical protein